MSKIYTDSIKGSAQNRKVTSQANAIPGRESEMARNNAGGVTFKIDEWSYLDRFLMLGTEGGHAYGKPQDVTKMALTNLRACVKADPVRVVERAFEFSDQGRAPKNAPAVIALALVASLSQNSEAVALAYERLPGVARIATDLFLFVEVLNSLGKWNAAAKRGIANWYTKRSTDRLALQMLKYQNRNGWAHRDVLRLAHVKPTSPEMANLFAYSVGKELTLGAAVPQLLVDFEYLKRATTKKEVLAVIARNPDVTWEMVPTQFLKDPDVLMALLPGMGLTALIRKLGVLGSNGVLTNSLSEGYKIVREKLSDAEALKKQRVHPITILSSMAQYRQGRGEKGDNTWPVVQQLIGNMTDAFYAAFDNVEATDDNYFLGIDCSGSMFSFKVNNSALTAAEVAAVMAMAIVRKQKNYWVGGFNTKMGELKISPSMTLDKVMEVTRRFSWGDTDCSLPALTALEMKMKVDKLVIITDNETWAGRMQPTQALKQYRDKMNQPQATQFVIATSVTDFTIADPKDPLQVDIAGFDAAAPRIIAEFGGKNQMK